MDISDTHTVTVNQYLHDLLNAYLMVYINWKLPAWTKTVYIYRIGPTRTIQSHTIVFISYSKLRSH